MSCCCVQCVVTPRPSQLQYIVYHDGILVEVILPIPKRGESAARHILTPDGDTVAQRRHTMGRHISTNVMRRDPFTYITNSCVRVASLCYGCVAYSVAGSSTSCARRARRSRSSDILPLYLPLSPTCSFRLLRG